MSVDELLFEAEASGLPEQRIRIGAVHASHAANELLEKGRVEDPPVPIDGLASLCEVLVLRRAFPDALSGLLIELEEAALIGVNSHHAHVRQRFSSAHELGHHLLGHGERIHIDVTDSNPPGFDYRSERAANDFAADLLMPRRLIAREFARDPQTPVLAQRFDVSEIAMGYRLVNLGFR